MISYSLDSLILLEIIIRLLKYIFIYSPINLLSIKLFVRGRDGSK